MSEYHFSRTDLACSSAYVLPAVREALGDLAAGSSVVDFGCGNGSLLAELQDRGWRLAGFEVSESGIEVARNAHPEIRFEKADLTGDLTGHPLAGTCDALISTEVVEHVFLPRLFVRNCMALLKPSGRLVLSTPYHGYWKNLVLAATGKLDGHFTALWDYGHIKFWSRQTLTELLEESGFEVTGFKGVGRLPYLWKSMILVARKPAR